MLYDDQALGFDERAGMPQEAAEEIAATLWRSTSLDTGARALDIGAGTGLLSMAIARRAATYVGIDRSAAMLDVFRARAAAQGLHVELLEADGNEPWPAAANSIDLVFSARALHHVDADHAVREARRVLCAGGWLAVGNIRRPADSAYTMVRRRMRDTLREAGYRGHSHGNATRDIFEALEALGAKRAEPCEAARWTRMYAPISSLVAWEAKQGLGGHDLAPELKERILGDVRVWAVERFGDLERELPQEEYFELATIQLAR